MRKYISDKILTEKEIENLKSSHKFYKFICKQCEKETEACCANKNVYCRACSISITKKKLFKSDAYRESVDSKKKETSRKKYGCDVPSQSVEVINKMKETCLKKYGTEFYLQTQDCRNKTRETSLEKYGVEHPMKSEAVKNNFYNSMLNTYGVEHALQSKDIQKNLKHKRFYDNFYFDSNDEIEFYKILKEKGVEFEMQKKYPKPYIMNGEEHFTFIDFYIPSEDLWVEVKGRQFFDDNLNPVFLYGNKNDVENNKQQSQRWKEKFYFLRNEGVKIITLTKRGFIEIID